MVLVAAREVRLVAPHVSDVQPEWVMPQVKDPKRVIDALASFFMRKGLLSREEFARIASNVSAEG